jgi:hypothetical protein
MPRWIHRFRVRGIGQFPIDMLRYDGCFPSSEQDSGEIALTFSRFFRSDDINPISLTKIADTKSWTPEHGRWNSFLWKITETEEPRKV